MVEEVRWVGLILMDASERKRSEEALRKTEKLAATGRLAASIAHEINNPLEAITNLLYLLSNHPSLDEQARGFAEMAEHEVRRISEITQQTLRFYRQSTLPTRAKLSELLDSVLALHQGRLRNLGISVEREYDADIDLNCYAGELRQVFANLVGNAVDAMPTGGRLAVRARRSRDWSDLTREGVRFQVSDTGSGMGPGVQKRIFEPFFTTKEVTGTGLGLWVSSEIVAKHRGTIRVRSYAAGNGSRRTGTVFELFFPDSAELKFQSDPEGQAIASVSSV
jgi:signal transduction histidine kinase